MGEISDKDMTNNDDTQVIESVEQTEAIISEVFNSEEKILPDTNPKDQYEFARNFLKVGDFDNAEKALREFVITHPNNELSGYDTKKLSTNLIKTNKIRLLSGPYNSINLMKNDYIQLKKFGFEELDITIYE